MTQHTHDVLCGTTRISRTGHTTQMNRPQGLASSAREFQAYVTFVRFIYNVPTIFGTTAPMPPNQWKFVTGCKILRKWVVECLSRLGGGVAQFERNHTSLVGLLGAPALSARTCSLEVTVGYPTQVGQAGVIPFATRLEPSPDYPTDLGSNIETSFSERNASERFNPGVQSILIRKINDPDYVMDVVCFERGWVSDDSRLSTAMRCSSSSEMDNRYPR